jgi:hypothetical protein
MRLNKTEWNHNKEIYAWIFDVGRGLSAFVKTPDNFGVMVDCGCSDDFKPFRDIVGKRFLPCLDRPVRNGRQFVLAQLLVSHPHSDHCSEFEDVLRQGAPMFLTTPHSNPKEPDANQYVNWGIVLPDNRPGTEGSIIALKEEINRRDPPLMAYVDESEFTVPDFRMVIFFIPPKINETQLPSKDYTNNLSIVLYMSLSDNSILFMGDLMPSGTDYLLSHNADFRRLVSQGVSVLVVPHHGLESGYCSSLYSALPACKVGAVNIISEKRSPGPNEGSTHCNYTSSMTSLGHKNRNSYSTKQDGHIRIVLGAAGKLRITASKNIDDLLED